MAGDAPSWPLLHDSSELLANCSSRSRDFHKQAAAYDRAVSPLSTLTVSATSLPLLLLQPPIRGATVGERHHTAICRHQACVPALHNIARSPARNIDATAFSSFTHEGSKPPIYVSAGHEWVPDHRQAPPILRCALVTPLRRSRHGPLDFIAAARIAGPCHSLSLWPLARRFRRSAASWRRSSSRVRLSVNRLANGPTKPFFR